MVENGRTVVAEVDGAFTVKRLLREADGRVHLQPATSDCLPLVLAAERVRIVGPVVGIFRRQGFRTPARRAIRPPTGEGRTFDLALHGIAEVLRAAEARGISLAIPEG